MEFKKIRNKKFILFGLILLFCCVGVFGGVEEGMAQSCSSNFTKVGDLNPAQNASLWCLAYRISTGSCNLMPDCFEYSGSYYKIDCAWGAIDCECSSVAFADCDEACVADSYDKGSCITGGISCDSGKCGYPAATDCIYKCTDKSGTACTKTCTCYDMDKNCGSTQAECIVNCKAEGCAAAGCPGVGETDPHNACVAGACVSVPGCGVSDCSACSGCPGVGETDPHNECNASDECVSVPGCGVSDCSACSGCPGVGETDPHNACVAGACVSVPGCGVSDCSACSGGTCTPGCSNTPPCYCDPGLVEHCGASPGSVFCDNCCPSGLSSCGLCGATPPPTCSPPCVSPQTCVCVGGVCACEDPGTGGSTIWPVTFPNPLDTESFEELIASVINWLLAIVGSIVLLFIIIAGIMYMTAAGDEAQLTRAKKMLFYTILGFAIILISYSLIKEIKDILGITS